MVKTCLVPIQAIGYGRAHQVRAIAKHPEIVERVKANEDIATRTAVVLLC